MKKIAVLATIVVFACAAHTKPKHLKPSEVGEYLEYDIESRPQAVQRELSYHSKQVIAVPIKATRWGTSLVYRTVKRTKTSIQQFFSKSRSIHGKNRRVKKALNDWQGLMYYNDYNSIDERNDQISLISIVDDSWYLLKKSLYRVGVDLPRQSWRTLKAAFYGTFGTLYE